MKWRVFCGRYHDGAIDVLPTCRICWWRGFFEIGFSFLVFYFRVCYGR